MRHAVIVTAAGSSCRFNANSNSSQKKEFLTIENHSVLYRAVEPFMQIDGLCAVVITYQNGTLNETKKAVEDLPSRIDVPFYFVEGGETRQKSVFNGLKILFEQDSNLHVEYVSIHDGARPYITKQLIAFTLASAIVHGAAAPAISVSDTLVRKDSDNLIVERINRENVCRIQTPQIFKFPDIFEAHIMAQNSEKPYTDDTEIYNDFGRKVALVEGDSDNTKITYRKDLC